MKSTLYCNQVTSQKEQGDGKEKEIVRMQNVYQQQTPEEGKPAKIQASGTLDLIIEDPSEIGKFVPGKIYVIEFTEQKSE